MKEKIMKYIARIVPFIFILLCLIGCKSIQYVPVETVLRDTTYIAQTKIDSVYQRDSVYIEAKGDTIYKTKYKYLYKLIQRHDTLWRQQTDTITQIKTVEARLTKWQKFKMTLGNTFIVVLIICLVIVTVIFLVKHKA